MTLDDEMYPTPRPRTAVVLVLLVLASLTFSYLGSFAIPDVLVSSQVMSPWPHDMDPRPHWMVVEFLTLFGGLTSSAIFVKFLSWRQIRRIDEMAG